MSMDLPKLNLIAENDNLRPAFECILLTRKHMVATNGQVLCGSMTKNHFSKDFIEQIPKEGVLIHRADWGRIFTSRDAQWEGRFIKFYFDKKRPVIVEPIAINKFQPTFPKWEAIIPDNGEIKAHSRDGVLGINGNLLSRIQKCFKAGGVELYFQENPNYGIIVKPMMTPIENGFALIMPVMIGGDISFNVEL